MTVAAIGLTLVIFGLAIFFVTRHLRQQIRSQITGRDAEILQAVVTMQAQADAEALPEMSLREPAAQMSVMLRTSRLKGVIAARLYDRTGRFVASFPMTVRAGTLSEADGQALRELRRVSRYYDRANTGHLFINASEASGAGAPLLEVLLPLAEKDEAKLLGAAQFFVDGSSLAAEFARLDRSLLLQSGAAFLTGSLILVLGLGWVLNRLQKTNRELARANEELVLAAKVSAVGAVAAHLIHGLKSPLTGLHNLIASLAPTAERENGRELTLAVATARQLLATINETSRLLKQQAAEEEAETSLGRLVQLLAARLQSDFARKNARLQVAIETDAQLSERAAKLVPLILQNLLRNALEATPGGGAVHLTIKAARQQVACEVRDEGPGFPAHLRESVFLPCPSSKPGGLGIGLAISKQLANHLDASLSLAESSTTGCTFTLLLPVSPLRGSRPESAKVSDSGLVAV